LLASGKGKRGEGAHRNPDGLDYFLELGKRGRVIIEVRRIWGGGGVLC